MNMNTCLNVKTQVCSECNHGFLKCFECIQNDGMILRHNCLPTSKCCVGQVRNYKVLTLHGKKLNVKKLEIKEYHLILLSSNPRVNASFHSFPLIFYSL